MPFATDQENLSEFEFVQEDDGDDEEEGALDKKIQEEHAKFQEAQAKWREELAKHRAWSAPPLGSPPPFQQKQREIEKQESDKHADELLTKPREDYIPPERPYVPASESNSYLTGSRKRPQSADSVRSRYTVKQASMERGLAGIVEEQHMEGMESAQDSKRESETSQNSPPKSESGQQQLASATAANDVTEAPTADHVEPSTQEDAKPTEDEQPSFADAAMLDAADPSAPAPMDTGDTAEQNDTSATADNDNNNNNNPDSTSPADDTPPPPTTVDNASPAPLEEATAPPTPASIKDPNNFSTTYSGDFEAEDPARKSATTLNLEDTYEDVGIYNDNEPSDSEGEMATPGEKALQRSKSHGSRDARINALLEEAEADGGDYDDTQSDVMTDYGELVHPKQFAMALLRHDLQTLPGKRSETEDKHKKTTTAPGKSLAYHGYLGLQSGEAKSKASSSSSSSKRPVSAPPRSRPKPVESNKLSERPPKGPGMRPHTATYPKKGLPLDTMSIASSATVDMPITTLTRQLRQRKSEGSSRPPSAPSSSKSLSRSPAPGGDPLAASHSQLSASINDLGASYQDSLSHSHHSQSPLATSPPDRDAPPATPPAQHPERSSLSTLTPPPTAPGAAGPHPEGAKDTMAWNDWHARFFQLNQSATSQRRSSLDGALPSYMELPEGPLTSPGAGLPHGLPPHVPKALTSARSPKTRPASARPTFGRSTEVAITPPRRSRPASAQPRLGPAMHFDDLDVVEDDPTTTAAAAGVRELGGYPGMATAAVDVGGLTVSVYVADTVKKVMDANRNAATLGSHKRYRVKSRNTSLSVEVYDCRCVAEGVDSSLVPAIRQLSLKQFLGDYNKLKRAVGSGKGTGVRPTSAKASGMGATGMNAGLDEVLGSGRPKSGRPMSGRPKSARMKESSRMVPPLPPPPGDFDDYEYGGDDGGAAFGGGRGDVDAFQAIKAQLVEAAKNCQTISEEISLLKHMPLTS